MNWKPCRVGVVAMSVLMLTQSLAHGLLPRSESSDPTERVPPPAKPDLVVQILPGSFPPSRFTVKNIGGAAAGPSTLKISCEALQGGPCLFFDHKIPKWVQVPALPSKGEHAVMLDTTTNPWTIPWPRGEYRFTATADAKGQVAESNEANNTASARHIVP